MTDVARRTSFRAHGAQEVWAGYQTPSAKVDRQQQRARKGRGHRHHRQHNKQETTFQLQLLAPVPASLAVAQSFDVVLHVAAHTTQQQTAAAAAGAADPLASGQLWAVATLTTYSGDELRGASGTFRSSSSSSASSSSSSSVLAGVKLIDTVHAFDDNGNGGGGGSAGHDTRGYVSFPSLSINAAGVYRLKVTLMRMDPYYASQAQGAEAVQVLLSHQIVVVG